MEQLDKEDEVTAEADKSVNPDDENTEKGKVTTKSVVNDDGANKNITSSEIQSAKIYVDVGV